MLRKIHILLLALILTASSAFAASVKVSVSPQRGKSRIEVGDLFYLTIEVSNITSSPARPDNVGGARLVYFDRTREESGFSSINGVTTQSYAATYTINLNLLVKAMAICFLEQVYQVQPHMSSRP